MDVKEFREMFSPWFDVVTKQFQGSFTEDYDTNILALLHENVDREIKILLSAVDRYYFIARSQALYNVLTYLYEHMLWKLRKEDFPNATFSCVRLLSQLIKTGLLVTRGNEGCEYIDRILTALKLYTGKPALLYDALLLVNGLKKLHQRPYFLILRCVMKTDYKEITDPLVYMGIILLFRRFRALSDSSNKSLYSLATKLKPPSNLISWLISLNVEESTPFLKILKHKKIVHQLIKKNIPEPLLKKIRHMILWPYYFEERCNLHREMIASENSSNSITNNKSSLMMYEFQPVNFSNKNIKRVDSKKQKMKKPKKDFVSNEKILDNRPKKSTTTDNSVYYINNYSNLVIENEHSDSLQEADDSEMSVSSNLEEENSQKLSTDIVKQKKSSKKRKKSKQTRNSLKHSEDLQENGENEIINVGDSASSDNTTDIPAKKLKQVYTIDRSTKHTQTSLQCIQQKRDYSENECLGYSGESEIKNVKPRKKIKYNTDKNVINENSLENCYRSSESDRANMCIASEKEIQEHGNYSSDDEVTIVTEVIRNKKTDVQRALSETNNSISSKLSKIVSKNLKNITYKDKNEPSDHQTANQIQTSPGISNNTKSSKKRKRGKFKAVSEKDKISENILQNLANGSLSQDSKKSENVIQSHAEVVTTYQWDSYIQSENRLDDLVQKDLESTPEKCSKSDNVLQHRKKSENILQSIPVESVYQSETYSQSQDDTKPENTLQKVEGVKYTSQTDLLEGELKSEKIYQCQAEVERTCKKDLKLTQDITFENNLNTDSITENCLQNDFKTVSMSQDDNNYRVKSVQGDTQVEKAYQEECDSQKETKSKNILYQEAVMENSSHTDSNTVSVSRGDKKSESMIDIENEEPIVAQNDACALSQDDTKSKQVLQNDVVTENSSCIDPITISAPQGHKRAENMIEGEVKVLTVAQDDTNSENAPQTGVVMDDSSHTDKITISVSQNDQIYKNIIQSCEKIHTAANDDACSLSQVDTKSENTLQEEVITENPSYSDSKVVSVSQNDKCDSIVEGDKVQTTAQTGACSLTQDDTKSENMLQEEAVTDNSSHDYPERVTVSQEDGSIPQIEEIVHTVAQNKVCSLSQIDKKSENVLHEEIIMENTSNSQDDKKFESVVEGEKKLQLVSLNSACSLSRDDTSPEDILQKEVSLENSSNTDLITASVPQDDTKSENMIENDVKTVSQNDSCVSQDNTKSENMVENDVKTVSQNDLCLSQDDTKSENGIKNVSQDDLCCMSQDDIKSESLLQEDEIIENSANSETVSVSKEDKKSESMVGDEAKVQAASQSDSCSVTQDNTKPGNILEDSVVTDASSHTDPKTATVSLGDKETASMIAVDGRIQTDAEDNACSLSKDDNKKTENILQKEVVVEKLSHTDPMTVNVSQDDNEAESMVEEEERVQAVAQNDEWSLSQDGTKSENMMQEEVVIKNVSQTDLKTVSISDDNEIESMVEDEEEVLTVTQNDACSLSQDNTKFANTPQKEVIAENSSHTDLITGSVSPDDQKVESMVENEEVLTAAQIDECILSQEDTKSENILQNEVVTKSSSLTDPLTGSASQASEEGVLTVAQNDARNLSQDNTKFENIPQKEVVAENSSHTDLKSGSVSLEDQEIESMDENEVLTVAQTDACIMSQGDTKFESVVQKEVVMNNSSHTDLMTANVSQDDRKSQSIAENDKKVKNVAHDVPCSLPHDDTKLENIQQEEIIAENSTHSDPKNISMSQNNESIVEGDKEVQMDTQTDACSLPQDDTKSENILQKEVVNELSQSDPKTVSLSQCDSKAESLVEDKEKIHTVSQNNESSPLRNNIKSENMVQEEVVTEVSSHTDSVIVNVSEYDKEDESKVEGKERIQTVAQTDVCCSLLQDNTETESRVIMEDLSQTNPKIVSVSQSCEKYKNSDQGDTEVLSKFQEETDHSSKYEKVPQKESVKENSLANVQNNLPEVQESVCSAIKCDIPNVIDKNQRKDNLNTSSYPVLSTTTSSNINISCDISKNVTSQPPTKDSVQTSETDSEEIDVVNTNSDSELDALIAKVDCSSLDANVINKLPSVAENKSTSEMVEGNQSIKQRPLKDVPKTLPSEYVPQFCKNKDYVSFSDISQQNKNKNIVLDSSVKSPNPISNFSSAATAEIFCEYRNDLLQGDKTDVLSGDDALSNIHESPSLSSEGSDEEVDSQMHSSAEEDNLMNDTEKTSDDSSNKAEENTSNSSVLLKNSDDPLSKNQTDVKDCMQNENECLEASSPGKDSNEKLSVRQSQRLRHKAEAKNEASTEVTDSVSHKSDSVSDDFIPSSAISNKNIKNISHVSSMPEDEASKLKSVSKKSMSVSKRKSKTAVQNCVSPPKGYSLRHRKSRKMFDDSSNLGIDMTKLKLDSPSSNKSTRSKFSTKDIKFAKLLTSEVNSLNNSDSNESNLSTKRETRSSCAKIEEDATQNTPGYNLRTRTSIIAPGKLKL